MQRVKQLSHLGNVISIIDAKHEQSATMRLIHRPCIQCGELVRNKTRCVECERQRQSARNQSRLHYKGDYAKRARLVRETALICAICGQPSRPNDPFTADHIVPGEPGSLLRAAHRSCNSARGNRI